MRVKWTRAAKGQLIDIHRYIAANSPTHKFEK